MYLWYHLAVDADYLIEGFRIELLPLPMERVWWSPPSESCMMIPGTYAQMRADYD